MTSKLSYDVPGSTEPSSDAWTARPAGFAAYERRVRLGVGDELWETTSRAVLDWCVKTRSGFAVRALDGPDTTARVAADYAVTARLGPVRIREPVRVVAVTDQPARCGFAYGTRLGHPVSGEEAFIVHRSDDGAIWLTLRSLTRPASGPWRYAYPLVLIAQRWYRRRYLRSLRPRS